jgi:hypothetical protein
MKQFVILAVLLFSAGLCQAQDATGEFQGFYQRMQSFDFNSGSTSFDIRGAKLNGGGFGFLFNITDTFGFWQQTSFYRGVKQSGLALRPIIETQGVQLSKEKGALSVYIRGGLGGVRHVLEMSGGTVGVDWGLALIYGGGTKIKVSEGLFWIIDASRITMGLPNLTNLQGRSKWDSGLLFTTGIAIRF